MAVVKRIILDAHDIALFSLHSCVTPLGLVAGTHHFVDLWARDSLFATFGVTAIEDFQITKKTIGTFFRYQQEDGLIPYRILRSPTTIGKYFGKPRYYATPRADTRSHQSGGIVLDGGLMTVVAMGEYIRKSHDLKFLKKHYTSLLRTLRWYMSVFGSDLTREWFQCEWADQVLKVGNVLYTNVLYYRALVDMSELAFALKDEVTATKYKQYAVNIHFHIQKTFWNGKYFADWHDYKRQDYFSSGSNMLAAIFGIADKKQATSILDYANTHCWNGFTLESNYPRYPWWRIPIQNYICGIPDYCNRGLLWLQPGILYAYALHQQGAKTEAKKILDLISGKIVEFQTVYEVYEKSGNPVNRFAYKSEGPFSWSAGLFLWAYNKIYK